MDRPRSSEIVLDCPGSSWIVPDCPGSSKIVLEDIWRSRTIYLVGGPFIVGEHVFVDATVFDDPKSPPEDRFSTTCKCISGLVGLAIMLYVHNI